MWLSRKFSAYRAVEQEGTVADMGVTTIGGASASVMTRGEQRDLEVFAPGGLVWQPRAGDTVLVIKGGVGCQERCVVAAETASAAPEDMAPGELFLYSSEGSSIHLKNDGSIAIKGDIELEADAEITGNIKLEGNTEIKGNIKVTGNVEIEGKLYINKQLCPACGL